MASVMKLKVRVTYTNLDHFQGCLDVGLVVKLRVYNVSWLEMLGPHKPLGKHLIFVTLFWTFEFLSYEKHPLLPSVCISRLEGP